MGRWVELYPIFFWIFGIFLTLQSPLVCTPSRHSAHHSASSSHLLLVVLLILSLLPMSLHYATELVWPPFCKPYPSVSLAFSCHTTLHCISSSFSMLHSSLCVWLIYTGMADLSDTSRWWFNCVWVNESVCPKSRRHVAILLDAWWMGDYETLHVCLALADPEGGCGGCNPPLN